MKVGFLVFCFDILEFLRRVYNYIEFSFFVFCQICQGFDIKNIYEIYKKLNVCCFMYYYYKFLLKLL